MSSSPIDVLATHHPLVCVVDRDPGVRRQVGSLLRMIGASVVGYGTAQEFLQSLSAAVPACLIVEAALPGLSGLALLQELRGRGLRIPTILLSEDADVTGAVRAMRAGALDFIEKPYIDSALISQVAAILDLDVRQPQ